MGVSTVQFNKDHLKFIKQVQKKREAIVRKLKHHVANKGYYEDMGQNELRQFKEWLNEQDVAYNVVAQQYDHLSNDIDNL